MADLSPIRKLSAEARLATRHIGDRQVVRMADWPFDPRGETLPSTVVGEDITGRRLLDFDGQSGARQRQWCGPETRVNALLAEDGEQTPTFDGETK